MVSGVFLLRSCSNQDAVLRPFTFSIVRCKLVERVALADATASVRAKLGESRFASGKVEFRWKDEYVTTIGG